jgi:glycosyltransferase involved in cell wall biosynthesis
VKIAVLSPVAWRTPPRKYGPWEQVASNIAEGMVAYGMDVTLFASGDSVTSGTLASVCDLPYAEHADVDPKVAECLHISNLMEQASSFDLIHNNFDFLPLTYSRLIDTPMLTTIHGFSSPRILEVYEKYNSTSSYVSISNADRSDRLRYTATVYNGIDTKAFTYSARHRDYLLFFGRIHPDKGTHESIQIAKRAQKKLIISGIIQDQQYFDLRVKPFINDHDIVFTGNSGPYERNTLMGGAYALLHPIGFEEPFGLSVAEAMLCGTPVIAFNRGSMPELIVEGKTGFLVDTVDEAVDAVHKVKYLGRRDCYDWASSNFSIKKMIEGYVRVYNDILKG